MTEPLRLLIGALGGEGGGVLAGWITDAAVAEGCRAQRTSIPGVAQRTGATTYYLEILPRAAAAPPPVLALNPAPARVDVVLASELLEAARAVQNGFVTPDRTLLVASTHRVFTVTEKAQMADGRLDGERLRDVATRFARRALLADIREVAEAARAPLNAVMFGALAGTGALPMPADAFRDAIRRAGKAVDGNLRGFDAGLRLADRPEPRTEPAGPQAAAPAEAVDFLPGDAGRVAAEGLRRLADYQDE